MQQPMVATPMTALPANVAQAAKNSTWTSVSVSQIPNITVFTDLFNYARRQGY
jgi:hypothetical protein